MKADLARRLAAELFGSLVLAGTVIGSGILAVQLSGGNAAVALIGNTGATAAMLYVLIEALGPISGAHFNPAVSLVMTLRRELPMAEFVLYALVQVAGCVLGAALAHAMFSLPLLQGATTDRGGAGRMLAEGVATFALVAAILLVSRARPNATPAAVALVIAAGYWWTSSTSFANPAITVARALSDTFAGVRPADVPGFVIAQFAGALAAAGACGWLISRLPAPATR